MLLTITTTGKPATDLGYLLHKHPDRLQSLDVPSGTAYVFYPEAAGDRCTAALLLDVDPIALVRGRKGGHGEAAPGEAFTLGQYVNDRPYAASSLLAMALKAVFRTAFTGRCEARPDLAAARIPLEITVPALRCRGGAELVHRVFEPLGWRVDAVTVPLDPEFPDWGASPYADVRLTGEVRLAEALNSCMCCCRRSTTPSTTASPRTRLTSWSGPAAAGWPVTPSMPSSAAVTWRTGPP